MSNPCFCILLRQAARKSSSVYDRALAPLGINVAQFSLLRKIARAQSISLTELARLADLDRSTMGRNAKVLQRMDLIEQTSGEDHRETHIALTSTGRDLVERGGPLWDQAQDEIEAKLGNEGVEQLLTLLRAFD
ncbi:MarR family winged helix-turn-helix transcriptional regulator [Brucella pseudogrignonensis]|jgi:DNA-binding MarR family transcriptional regulator|uniref:MarR family winged helix-turn-helix transcriptional regulator n=1 Tax=Brucella pseudogrignonensis TaxID=419475 RepID=UPI000CFDB93F|nr:MarR family winged helix-turn-helix transcriptional regulator [Brucella pseudogrignonensis]MBK0021536.1 winged helix-turn-helix transcriptional regulator [Ochrobactrum sp. S45]MBK0041726.1 winged helix-turn-helix transcriptional regulator [Ochrobactrum sp. S46]MBO1023356.1 winged helix-turn-helix transcriptional regulator [Ochrobactrum sp. SD129]MQP39279.1 MarR family transcriptional regulator [Ochrobactrum sp. MYb237]PQZ43855.1 MarR family transcriptional regulator [Brucella pseudogrignone